MIMVSCPQRAETNLQAGVMRCPRCEGQLGSYGHARTRTVRGLGADTLSLTPRRAAALTATPPRFCCPQR